MRYIIVSKGLKEGKVGSDSILFEQYFELGWEMVTTRFILNRMYNSGEIDLSNDIVVSQDDRLFLYNHLYNVMSYKNYNMLENSYIPDSIDLVRFVQEKGGRDKWDDFTNNFDEDRKYKYFEEDKELNTSFNCLDMPYYTNKPYVCLSIRKRGHAAYRNMPDEYAFNLIEQLKIYVDRIYIFGKGTEYFCDSISTFHVNLQEFASLCSNEMCLANIGSFSGAMFVPIIFGKARYNIVIDFNADSINFLKIGDPLYMSKCVRYSDSEFITFSGKYNIDLKKYLI